MGTRPARSAPYADRVDLIVSARRLGYRTAYVGLRAYWFLARPETRGVKCVLTNRGRVLLVRHSYGPRVWDLPGGSVKSDEPPEDAARREMQEELGVDVSSWHPIGHLEAEVDHRNDRIDCFVAELDPPDVQIDGAELTAARWFDRGELEQVGVHTARILAMLDEAGR